MLPSHETSYLSNRGDGMGIFEKTHGHPENPDGAFSDRHSAGIFTLMSGWIVEAGCTLMATVKQGF